MPPDATRPLLLASALLALAALLGGCGSSAECVIDSDCTSLAHRCEANKCVPLGGPAVDLGVADLGRRDGAITDGAPTDGSGEGGVDGGAQSELVGEFIAESDPAGYAVSASFTETPPTPAGPCTKRSESPCEIIVCTPGASTAIARSAGGLTLSGGTLTVSIAPNLDDTYTTSTGGGPFFSAGTALTFEGTGGTPGVPAFSSVVAVPDMATLTMPALGLGSGIVVSRVDPFMLAWTPTGPIGMVEVNFVGIGTTGDYAGARCRFEPGAFSGAVPATVFSDFPIGATGSYSFYVEAETELTPGGGWTITLGARSPMLVVGGVASTGPASF